MTDTPAGYPHEREDACLKILSANTRKSSDTCLSILNNSGLSSYSYLLLSEPWARERNGAPHSIPMHHPQWSPIYPSKIEATAGVACFRAMIWVRKHLKPRQVLIQHQDMAAVSLAVGNRRILMVSIYIPCSTSSREQNLEELCTRLEYVSRAYENERRTYQNVELFVAGDFNRWDSLWGGNEVQSDTRQGEGTPIVNFMAEHGLQSLLPRGTPTFFGDHNSRRRLSTIDLVLATEDLAGNMLRCRAHGSQHGSDHEAIETHLNLQAPQPTSEPKRLWKSAPWSKIRDKIQESVEEMRPSNTPSDIDGYYKELQRIILKAIEELVPLAKPSPYAKRWWNTNLTDLRKAFTKARNLARRSRRWGHLDQSLDIVAREAKRTYFYAIRSQKKKHWEEFLDDTENIWQAAKYLSGDEKTSFSSISTMVGSTGELVHEDNDIAEALLTNFFPPLPPYPSPSHSASSNQLPMVPIIDEEIRKAIMSASPHKAPGRDGLPAVVWQHIWPTIGQQMSNLFRECIRVGRIPREWKTARIIPLRKPDKPDYTVANAYRPISLLYTISKAFEAVIATRIAYLAETHGLLPPNHFGALKGRSTIDALQVLQEKIHQAWRDKKVLSLVTFDVKGAFNGVAIDVLTDRLRKSRIPEQLVSVIQDLVSNRRASVMVNGKDSEITNLQHAGLPQGSPLSPILFLFFNADLVRGHINRNRGSIAFVDDYSAWFTGDSIQENVEKLQTRIIPRLENWSHISGAIFQPAKTVLTHFSRRRKVLTQEDPPLLVHGVAVESSKEIKILGVVLDSKLTYKSHIARAAKKGTAAALALKRLRNLRPETARQLYTSTVVPRMDYASMIWGPNATRSALSGLDRAQRIGAQAVVGAFKTVSLVIAESEAGLEGTLTRLRKRNMATWVQLQTKSSNHPF